MGVPFTNRNEDPLYFKKKGEKMLKRFLFGPDVTSQQHVVFVADFRVITVICPQGLKRG